MAASTSANAATCSIPLREPLSALERQRAAMTPLVFSAQFQQSPIPLEGNLIKREWIRYFSGNPPPQRRRLFCDQLGHCHEGK